MKPREDVLTEQELESLRQGLTKMSVTGAEEFFRAASYLCRSEGGHFPSPRAIQELGQASKQLRT